MRFPLCCLLVSLMGFCAFAEPTSPTTQPLDLHLRRRVETSPGSGEFKEAFEAAKWEPRKTAVVICDMWDKHWCKAASSRVTEMAPRMNELITALRASGVLIIHCPSDTMNYYKDHPGRKLAQSAPKVETTVPLQRWCKLDSAKEGPLPIDDSDGGCSDDPPSKTAI